MNIDAVIQQLSAFRQAYGDLPVIMLSNGVYAPLPNLPWLAYPIGQPPGPANYTVVFGPAAQATNYRENDLTTENTENHGIRHKEV